MVNTIGGIGKRPNKRRKMSNTQRKRIVAFFLFISPWLIGYLLFTLWPILSNIFYSFTRYDLVTDAKWIGLGNYKELIADDMFWQSLKVTLVYTVMYVPLAVIGSFLLALLLNQKIPLLGLWRTIFYLPVVTSGIAVSLLFMWIFQPNFGLVNVVLKQLFGIDGPGWFYDKAWAIPTIVIMGLWGVGGQMLIYLAGLQGVPTQYYEAAEIDGASSFRRFFHITVPMMTPIIFYNLILCIINSFQVFIPAFVITKGGPDDATHFYVLHLYNNGFKFFHYGYASALANVLFFIILALTFLLFKSSGKWVFGGEEGN